jgi:hypothetical protein
VLLAAPLPMILVSDLIKTFGEFTASFEVGRGFRWS